MTITSTSVLNRIKQLTEGHEEHPQIDIQNLAVDFNISVPALIAILTQLEHDDKITLEISTDEDKATHHLNQHGHVRLMHTESD